MLDAASAVFTRTTAGSFTVEWRNATFFGASASRVDFQLELFADGQLVIRYRHLDPTRPREVGSSAMVGIENAAGTVALQYAFGTPALSDAASVRFRPR